MAGRNLYRDYFSQGASSSDAPSSRRSTGVHDDDDLQHLSQTLTNVAAGGSFSSAREDLRHLDLNSQSEGFPFPDDRTSYLMEDGGFQGRTQGSRVQGGRNRGFLQEEDEFVVQQGSRPQGGRCAAFQPPHPRGGSVVSGCGGSQDVCGRRRGVGGMLPLGVGDGIGVRGRGRGRGGRGSMADWILNPAQEGEPDEEEDNEDEEENNGSNGVI